MTSVVDPACTPSRVAVARLAAEIRRALAEVGNRQHGLVVDHDHQLVADERQAQGPLPVEDRRVGDGRLRERRRVLLALDPLPDEVATAAVGRLDVEGVGREAFGVVDRGPEQNAEAGARREVDDRLDRAVALGRDVGEGPTDVGPAQRQRAVRAGGCRVDAADLPIGPGGHEHELGLGLGLAAPWRAHRSSTPGRTATTRSGRGTRRSGRPAGPPRRWVPSPARRRRRS